IFRRGSFWLVAVGVNKAGLMSRRSSRCRPWLPTKPADANQFLATSYWTSKLYCIAEGVWKFGLIRVIPTGATVVKSNLLPGLAGVNGNGFWASGAVPVAVE